MFDVIEVFYTFLSDARCGDFSKDINDSMIDFRCPWRLSDGEFFEVDSEFFHLLLDNSADFLRAAGFEGALDEFRKARSDLSVGDTKDAIHKANNSFESTLKAILGTAGTANDLCKKFQKNGFLDDVPAEARPVIVNLLTGLSFLRHKLGGHGQGPEVVQVPTPYAQLAVTLAGAFNLFAVQQHLQKQPKPETRSPSPCLDTEIPF
ncbi:hypothetical protein [Defluviicoccus vanus]|nr:hypothetical protein [Defluviicoccus vanus]